MRFGERLNYTIRIDSHLDLTQYQILPLLIQPIIENAVSHGLEDTGKEGHVILKIFRSKDDLLIADVFDNGIGMSPENLRMSLIIWISRSRNPITESDFIISITGCIFFMENLTDFPCTAARDLVL